MAGVKTIYIYTHDEAALLTEKIEAVVAPTKGFSHEKYDKVMTIIEERLKELLANPTVAVITDVFSGNV